MPDLKLLFAIGAGVSLIGLAGCDAGLQALSEDPKMKAELEAKGYATKNGRIVKVAEPEGDIIRSSEYFLPGNYIIQGYDAAGNPEFTDQLLVRELESPTKILTSNSLKMLQSRMKLQHPNGSYKTTDYPCEVYTVSHEADGHFNAQGICRMLTQGIIQEFSYSGETRQNGFVIDVVRKVRGDSGEEKHIRIIAHLKGVQSQ